MQSRTDHIEEDGLTQTISLRNSLRVFVLPMIILGCSNRGSLKDGGSGAAATTRLSPAEMPALERPTRPFLGILRYEVYIPDRGGARKLWVYLPERVGAGKLPCVLIAPAGTPLVHGMALGEGDIEEHVPYVLQGFA